MVLSELNYQRLKCCLFVLVVFLFLNFAMAADVPWEGPLKTIIDALTSTTGRLLAIGAVCFVGYRALFGHMPWAQALSVCLGIVLIFGAATVVDYIKSGF